MNKINIAIDGPAGVGKTFVGRELAKKINYNFLDTGVLYRVFSYFTILEKNNNFKDLINRFNFKIQNDKYYLNNQIIENINILNTLEVTNNIKNFSNIKIVRDKITHQTQEIAKNKGYVMVGRDTTSVILKDAEMKIYLDADFNTRLNRRYKDKINNNEEVKIKELALSMQKRDESDFNRKYGPLICTKDSILVKNDNMSIHENVEFLIKIYKDCIDEK